MDKGRTLLSTMVMVVIIFLLLFVISLAGVFWMERKVEVKGIVSSESRFIESSMGILFLNDITRYPARGNVTSLSKSRISVGIASQTYELNFGRIPENLTVRKFIDIANNEEVPVKICILKRGSIGPMLRIREDEFVLEEKGEREVELLFNGSEVGSYQGEIDVVVRKPRYWPARYLLNFLEC